MIIGLLNEAFLHGEVYQHIKPVVKSHHLFPWTPAAMAGKDSTGQLDSHVGGEAGSAGLC